MELLLIRYAESARLAAAQDRADPWLSDLGVSQAEALARYLSGERFDALYCSCQGGAIDTAAILGGALDLSPAVRDDLAEIDRDYGECTHTEDLWGSNDSRYRALQRDDLSPWGTDLATFRARVTSAVEEIINTLPDGRVAVVSQGGSINAYAGSVFGVQRLLIHSPACTGFARTRA